MPFRRRTSGGVVSKEDEIDLLITKGEKLVLALSQAVAVMQDRLGNGVDSGEAATCREEEDGSA